MFIIVKQSVHNAGKRVSGIIISLSLFNSPFLGSSFKSKHLLDVPASFFLSFLLISFDKVEIVVLFCSEWPLSAARKGYTKSLKLQTQKMTLSEKDNGLRLSIE